jgi:predicted RNA-binding Zn ribbon-like protein
MAVAFAQPSGSRALDLMNTVDWRDDPARRIDLMPHAAALADWARHEGFAVADARACRLPRHHRRATELRETLAVLFAAACQDAALPATALAALSKWTREAWHHRQLATRGKTPQWRWDPRLSGADRVLFTIALEAGELLMSSELQRVRVCAGEGCGWFFLDRSKAGRRRWCTMASCGNRVKVRSYRERVAGV